MFFLYEKRLHKQQVSSSWLYVKLDTLSCWTKCTDCNLVIIQLDGGRVINVNGLRTDLAKTNKNTFRNRLTEVLTVWDQWMDPFDTHNFVKCSVYFFLSHFVANRLMHVNAWAEVKASLKMPWHWWWRTKDMTKYRNHNKFLIYLFRSSLFAIVVVVVMISIYIAHVHCAHCVHPHRQWTESQNRE